MGRDCICQATPIAWYTMNKWLESFEYKTSLSWWIFALTGLLALGIALLTVSWFRALSDFIDVVHFRQVF